MSKGFVRLLVVAAVIIDAVLIVGVLRHVNRTPPQVDMPTKPSSSATPSGDKGSGQDDYDFKPAKSSVISLANDQTLLYAMRGKCDGDKPGKLVASTDGGASVRTIDTGLTEILAVKATSGSALHVVGAGPDCVLKKYESVDGGDTWTDDLSDSLWYPSLDDAKGVVSPATESTPGCIVTSVSQIGEDFGRVSCEDGTIRGTGNGGKKWVKLGRLDNVRVATFTTFNAGYALAVYQGCAAHEFSTRDGGRSWSPGGCITGEPAQAMGANDTTLVGVVDAELYASSDGKTWQQP